MKGWAESWRGGSGGSGGGVRGEVEVRVRVGVRPWRMRLGGKGAGSVG